MLASAEDLPALSAAGRDSYQLYQVMELKLKGVGSYPLGWC